MKKKPEGLHFEGQDTGLHSESAGEMVFEIRLAIGEDGQARWIAGMSEAFTNICLENTQEWREEMTERLLFLAEDAIMKELKTRPH